jgi:hypothetical protein
LPAAAQVLLMAMLAPRSYTSEDVVELHCHGGGICAQRVLQATIEAGARPARQGEFTLRAFLNGRLDLSQAESVLQLLQVGACCLGRCCPGPRGCCGSPAGLPPLASSPQAAVLQLVRWWWQQSGNALLLQPLSQRTT